MNDSSAMTQNCGISKYVKEVKTEAEERTGKIEGAVEKVAHDCAHLPERKSLLLCGGQNAKSGFPLFQSSC